MKRAAAVSTSFVPQNSGRCLCMRLSRADVVAGQRWHSAGNHVSPHNDLGW